MASLAWEQFGNFGNGFRVTRRASLRLEHPRLFIGHRETVLHVLGGRLALLVTIRGHVCVGLGWMGWILCVCVCGFGVGLGGGGGGVGAHVLLQPQG